VVPPHHHSRKLGKIRTGKCASQDQALWKGVQNAILKKKVPASPAFYWFFIFVLNLSQIKIQLPTYFPFSIKSCPLSTPSTRDSNGRGTCTWSEGRGGWWPLWVGPGMRGLENPWFTTETVTGTFELTPSLVFLPWAFWAPSGWKDRHRGMQLEAHSVVWLFLSSYLLLSGLHCYYSRVTALTAQKAGETQASAPSDCPPRLLTSITGAERFSSPQLTSLSKGPPCSCLWEQRTCGRSIFLNQAHLLKKWLFSTYFEEVQSFLIAADLGEVSL
jgi:hypothetical protein